MKNVLLFLADGFEEIEAISIVDVLRRGNVNCDICTIKEQFVKGTHDIIIKSDCHIDLVDKDKYDAVVLPGGLPGATNLKDKRVEDIVKKFNEENKIIGAICAAPETLEFFGILKNRKCTSYPGFVKNKEELTYIENEIVVIDKNIITSRGPATAINFALEILNQLGKIKESNEIKDGMLVNFYNSIVCDVN